MTDRFESESLELVGGPCDGETVPGRNKNGEPFIRHMPAGYDAIYDYDGHWLKNVPTQPGDLP